MSQMDELKENVQTHCSEIENKCLFPAAGLLVNARKGKNAM